MGAQAGSGNDDAKLKNVVSSFADAWNNHDMARFAGLFTDDADFVNVVGMWWKNRREIEAAHAHSHATFFKNSRLSNETAAVKFLRPDLATVHVRWTLAGQIEPDGSVGQPRHGILLLVCANHDGMWLVHTAQNTDTVAGALTQPAVPV